MASNVDFEFAEDCQNSKPTGLKEAWEGHSLQESSTELSIQTTPNLAKLVAWFAADQGRTIPPGDLLDVIVTLSGGHFLSNLRLGSELLAEFGSIGNVLAADCGRLSIWLEQQGLPKWFNEQLYLRLCATLKLMQLTLSETIKDKPLLTSWEKLLDYLKITLAGNSIEHFRVLFLDKKNFLIKDEAQQRGTVDHTPLYPREIAKRSLELGASAIIMVHNHPSGDPSPSRADIEMTKKVAAALMPLQILLHDHLIIGATRHLSFKSEGLI